MSDDSKKEVTSKPKTLRCDHTDCRKKLGLFGFDCRCGHQFCALHRAAESHNCTHDYKQEAKKELLKYMSSPVVGPKVAVI